LFHPIVRLAVLASVAVALYAPTASTASPLPGPEQVAAGGTHTCAIRTDGTLACWGDDSAGQLDEIPSGTFRSLSAGGTHTCAIRTDGTLACWGDDSAGQLDGVPSGAFLAVAAGGTHTCAIRDDGTLACWGDDSAGQLDEIPSGTFRSLSAGGTHTCAIRTDGTLACWGDDSAGQLYEAPEEESAPPHSFWWWYFLLHHHRYHPPAPSAPPKFLSVAAGGAHTCAVSAAGELSCWGDDSAGQLDDIPSGEFVSVSAGRSHSCAIRADSTLACWGNDSAGQLDSIPVGAFLAVTTGGTHSCATKSTGEIDCWGDNGAGQVRPLMLSTPLDEGNVDTPYDHRFETTPQAPGPTFSIASGKLPAGLELTPDGDLIGIPIEAGSFQFTVIAANGLTADAEEEVTLAVAPLPPAPVQTTVVPQDTGLPDPIAGVNVNLEPAGGSVKTKCPGDSSFVPLNVPTQIPLGCQVDTANGVVNLKAAKLGEEGFESAYFWGGTFAVGQSPGETELKLAGKLKCEKRKSAGRSKRARGSRIALRSNSGGGRKLWGSGKGNFKTSGNYGSATVRGTVWLVRDRCDNSTLFGVREGVVTVDDFVKGTTLFLYPGQRYVAKAAIPRLR
jgi:alpha-tubulin suppressor-like RCC1 family protein